MIYSQKANFPFPVLVSYEPSYQDALFSFDIDLHENTHSYILNISYDISSSFIRDILSRKLAKIFLIIKSRDNQFHELPFTPELTAQKEIKKSRLSLNKKTSIQLMVQSKSAVRFDQNDDLNGFFKEYKNNIVIENGSLLAMTEVLTLDGSQKKPLDIFEQKLDSNITSDIELRLDPETITIVYKDEACMFSSFSNQRDFILPYMYAGLQKALLSFLSQHGESGNLDDPINIEELHEDDISSPLNQKLLRLLKLKQIKELDLYNIDAIICSISEQLIVKYVYAVESLRNEN